MPTYEYLCSECQNQWEEIQKISEDPIQLCPKCGKSSAKRQISGGSFILKGGGWYADLYSSAKPKGNGKPEAKPESGSESDGAAPAKSESAASAPKADTRSSSGSSGSSGSGSGSGSAKSS